MDQAAERRALSLPCWRLALPRRLWQSRVRAISLPPLMEHRNIGQQEIGQGEGAGAVYASGLLAFAEPRLGPTARWLLAMARASGSVVVGTAGRPDRQGRLSWHL